MVTSSSGEIGPSGSVRVDDSHKYYRVPATGRMRYKADGLLTNFGGRGCTPCVVGEHKVVLPERGCPTSYVPGSTEKLQVFRARAKRREGLFHPFDARNAVCMLPLYWLLLESGEREKLVALYGIEPLDAGAQNAPDDE